MKAITNNKLLNSEKSKLIRQRYFSLSKLSRYGWSLVRAVLVIGISFVILYPLLVKFSVSIMDEKDLYDITVKYIPKHLTIENYTTVWQFMDYPKAFWNSFSLSMLASVMQLISCTLIAYGFARFNFPLKNILFGLVIVTLVVPPQTIMIPLFLHFRFFDVFGIVKALTGEKGINLLDSYWPFVLMSLTGSGMKNGLYIYILRQFFRGMPKELEEAAYVDGSSTLRTFTTIMLPSAVPMMVTVFLFSFVWQWNDSFYSSLFLQKLLVLPMSLSALSQNINQYYYWEYGQMGNMSPAYASMVNNTGSILLVVPLFLIYLFAQRYFVESIERSGIVG